MTTTQVCARVLDGFDDPAIGSELWSQLLREGETDGVNLTWQWQRTWWEAFGHGKLLLIGAELDGRMVALAPLFTDGGMIFNICPENHLDFVGDAGHPGVLEAILNTARACVPDFIGFRFYFVPDTSRTGERLKQVANRLMLTCHDEGSLPSPTVDIKGQPETALANTRKKSLVRHENYFRREGSLEVRHLTESADILPNLEEFFDMHVARRAATPEPSLFIDPAQRAYYRRMTQELSPTGWLRFTRIDWNGKAIAFHFGLCYRGKYHYGIPAFQIGLARHSPGEVLLRQLMLAAIDEGADTFDFGIGDEAYKYRFNTGVTELRTWGLYPSESTSDGGSDS